MGRHEPEAALEHRCAVLADSSARDWVDLILSAGREGARSASRPSFELLLACSAHFQAVLLRKTARA